MFISLSSVISVIMCIYTALMKVHPKNSPNPDWFVLIPLIGMGISYSIYASALWGSIPYVVQPKTIGSAFGVTTALQNAGLTLSPFIIGFELGASKNAGKENYYFSALMTLAGFATIGLIVNVWLYFDDIKNRNSVLNEVKKKG